MRRLYSSFQCIDPEEIQLYGHYDSSTASRLVFTFDRCDSSKPENECQPDVDFSEWSKTKFVAYLVNEKRLDLLEDSDDKNVEEATLHWIPINRIYPTSTTVLVQESTLHPEESLTSRPVDKNYFTVRDYKGTSFSNRYDDSTFKTLYVEMHDSQLHINVQTTSIIEQIIQIGGLLFVLLLISQCLVSIFRWNKVENELVGHLFKKHTRLGTNKKLAYLNATDQYAASEIWQETAPTCCLKRCGTQDSRDRWFEIGRKALYKELNVVNLLRAVRMVTLFAKQETSPFKW